MKSTKHKKQYMNETGGYTIFLAVIVMASLLLIAFSVVNISVKETQFSNSSRESQYALFAADAGIECALYWDGQVNSFDPVSPVSPINCRGYSISTGNTLLGTTTTAQIGGGGPVSWIFCANEGGTCSFPGTTQVRYGANGAYNYLDATGSIPCNNATFGDPIVGVVKQCHYATAGSGSMSVFGFSLETGANAVNPCVVVTVTKKPDLTTHIYSYGYNTCDISDPRRVERGIEVRY